MEELINDVSQATSAQLCSNVITRLVYMNDEQVNQMNESHFPMCFFSSSRNIP